MTEEKQSSIVDILDMASHEQRDLFDGFSIDKRIVTITGEITANTYQHVVSCVSALNMMDEEYTVILNSVGGEVSQGFAIYEILKDSPNHVTVHGVGQVMSIASIILQAGDIRLMTPLCRFMVHNGSITFDKAVDIDKFKSQLKDVQMDSEIYYDLLGERAKISRKKIKDMCFAERYLSAKQCLEMGFIDEIRPLIP
jgi:ATP-dependent Clp protease protease subunit